MADDNPPDPFSQAARDSLQEHLDGIRDKILTRAEEIAKKENATIVPGFIHLAQAIDEYAPGKKFPDELPQPQRSFWEHMFSSVTGVSAVLAFLFAAFGLLAIWFNAPELGGQNYLDIAKIFAGAIVGSTGVAATSAFREK